ncbi:hypothetical protein V8G54_026873 [Vigna mungo]|uniref:Uncharacterized protein n=1 Tax=Vigna mungo TaxID=3915 RepID=A0AAQ3RMJ1_VIGMU
MAYTQGFLQFRALTTPLRVSPKWEVGTTKPNRIVCKADKEDVQDSDATNLSFLSRRLALGTALIGGAAVAGTKASPARADDAQLSLPKPRILPLITSLNNPLFACFFSRFSFKFTFSDMSCNEFTLLATVAITTLPEISSEEYPASVVEALSLKRNSFPKGFVFGTASAAYQVYPLNKT